MEGKVREKKMDITNNLNMQSTEASKPIINGGLRTMPFIIVNEAFEKVASYGLAPNMIFYLKECYNIETAAAATILLLWSASSNMLAIFGAFLSDSYMGRCRVITLGSFSSLLGMTLLCLTSIIPQLKPSTPFLSNKLPNSSTGPQLALLYFSFALISIGAGCIRPCSIAFGADQLANKENPNNNQRVLDSFFNWYYASVGASTILALTLIVYIQDNFGWQVGFGVPLALMLFSVLIFLAGSSLYVKVKPNESLLTGFVQVIAVAFKNRKMDLPQSKNFDSYFHGKEELNFLVPTDNLRFLNKACIIKDVERDLSPWNICTVKQVESLKALLRIMPIFSSGIMMLVCLNQTSFGTLQASIMDRKVTPDFKIPAGSFSVFMIISLTIWVAFYDRVLVPFLARSTGQPRGLSPTVRMGTGLIVSCLAMAISALIEAIRRKAAIDEGFEDQPNSVVNMSALWVVPQFVLLGVAEGLNAIGQIEFFYSAFPKSMSSIAVALYTFEVGLASLVASFLVNIINSVTSKGGRVGWLVDNLNEGRLDYYYWLCTGLGVINFAYFLLCCWVYGSSDEDDGGDGSDMVHDFEYKRLPPS